MKAMVGWYLAKVVYLIRSPDVAGCGLVQEDLLLLRARDPEEAYRRAITLGREVGGFGKDLLDGAGSALLELGLGEVEHESEDPQGEDTSAVPRNLLHPGLANEYKEFRFLGLRELRLLPRGPAHGLVIETQERVVGAEKLEKLCSAKEDWQFVISPSGPALTGKAKMSRDAKLFGRYKWYLADLVLTTSERRGGLGDRASITERTVLIHADGPLEAVSFAKAVLQTSLEGPNCVALQSVALVESDLTDDCCELRSLIIELAGTPEDYVRPKQELAVFL